MVLPLFCKDCDVIVGNEGDVGDWVRDGEKAESRE